MTKWSSKDILGLRGLSREDIALILDTARSMKEIQTRSVKKVPTLRGKIVVNLFFEPSTRTCTSFELAAKRLSADVINFMVSQSSAVKGESVEDTAHTLRVMGTDVVVLRHRNSGMAHALAKSINLPVLNAGDGTNEHPSQALLDMFTIREHKGRIDGLTVTIVGDILHGRVAHSNIWGLLTMGAKVRLCGPPTLVPPELKNLGLEIYHNLDEAIDGADAINVLRIQKERMDGNFFPSLAEYTRLYGMNMNRLNKTKPGTIIMHPGPMNREVEITSEVADSPSSVILEQVTNGIAVRMALFYLLVSGEKQPVEQMKKEDNQTLFQNGKMKTLIKNARVLNPASQTDRKADVLIEGEFVSQISSSISDSNAKVIDADGHWLLPGLVDIHVHFREPGGEGIESIDSGSRAAAAGGVTSLVCMPDTEPPVDNRTGIEFVNDRVALSGKARVYPTGCITTSNKGIDLAPIGEMVEAGAVAVTEAKKGIMDAQLMRRAMEYSTIFKIPVLTHPEDHVLSNGSLVNEGNMSIRLGFIGSPNIAETVQISRDILLAKKTGAQLHILQVSCADSVDIIRFYKSKGVNVTASVTPHHLVLTEESVEDFNTMAKVKPPLRTKEDQDALFEGIKDGTIDCIVSGHQPCSTTGKQMNYMDAPFGISGLETLLPLTLDKIANRLDMNLLDLISLVTTKPAKIMTLPAGMIEQGEPADLTLWNPNQSYTIDKDRFTSNSHNTPFHKMDMKGRVESTFLGGRIVYQYAAE